MLFKILLRCIKITYYAKTLGHFQKQYEIYPYWKHCEVIKSNIEKMIKKFIGSLISVQSVEPFLAPLADPSQDFSCNCYVHPQSGIMVNFRKVLGKCNVPIHALELEIPALYSKM